MHEGAHSGFATFLRGHAKLKLCKSLQELAHAFLSKESLCDLFPSVSKLLVRALVCVLLFCLSLVSKLISAIA